VKIQLTIQSYVVIQKPCNACTSVMFFYPFATDHFFIEPTPLRDD